MGLICIDLGSLAVDPDFAGQGIATQLAQWGVARAEKDKVPAYLEASPAALRLYKRVGFAVVRDLDLLENGFVLTVMVKEMTKEA
jgi:predicted N-acetyltransferase YhbS